MGKGYEAEMRPHKQHKESEHTWNRPLKKGGVSRQHKQHTSTKLQKNNKGFFFPFGLSFLS